MTKGPGDRRSGRGGAVGRTAAADDRDGLLRRLAAAGLSDPAGARGALRRMAASPEEEAALDALLPPLLRALEPAAGPDAVLVSLERFSQSVRDRLALYRDLAEHPRWTEILVALFSGSQFLTEILLQHPDMFLKVVLPKLLAVRKPPERVREELRGALAEAPDPSAATEVLRRYQRLELLRIGASDLLGLFDLETVIAELSSLADGLVAAALDVAARDAGKPTAGFAVIAMGKLGGRELNYSSDIDLLLVARSDAPGFWGVGRRVIDLLGRFTDEGFLYRVDMRLRPWGEAGPLVSSVDSWLDYLGTHARLWERQALLKARVVAGDAAAGEEALARAQAVVFSAPPDVVRREVRAMREKTEEAVRRKGQERTEVKLGEGSIRDVEFVVQYLQLAHGGRLPALRCGNTLESLARLEGNGLLAPPEARILREGYVFLRTVEHHLQVMHYRQTHVLPDGPGPLADLARRLGFSGAAAGSDFQYRYREHTAAIRAIYRHHLGDQKMTVPTDTTGPGSPLERQHVARMDPSYAETFTPEEIARHARLAGELDDSHLSIVRAEPRGGGRWRVTIVGWDFPGELSLICGLLFANGFSIEQADAFTYEPAEETSEAAPRPVST
ncbi:MAG TPA: glutamine synthetase adenylyltransferase, partial [Thermoanaerobaculia bacterium]|nr:glutamine synthetase adenylyltransferase [Thermoanaerobaculia bacterium]